MAVIADAEIAQRLLDHPGWAFQWLRVQQAAESRFLTLVNR
jgi:hypothetical protein